MTDIQTLLVELIRKVVSEELTKALSFSAPLKAKAEKAAPKKTRNMQCRYPGCKNRSDGPRYKFMCKEHRGMEIPAPAPKAPRKSKKNGVAVETASANPPA